MISQDLVIQLQREKKCFDETFAINRQEYGIILYNYMIRELMGEYTASKPTSKKSDKQYCSLLHK